jgi:hypothetical protein
MSAYVVGGAYGSAGVAERLAERANLRLALADDEPGAAAAIE